MSITGVGGVGGFVIVYLATYTSFKQIINELLRYKFGYPITHIYVQTLKFSRDFTPDRPKPRGDPSCTTLQHAVFRFLPVQPRIIIVHFVVSQYG